MTRSALQLYTVRDFDADLPAVLEIIADAGFEGVEFAHRLHDAEPDDVKQALERTGLQPVGAHVELATLMQDWDAVTGRLQAVGCDRLIIPHLPADRFLTYGRIDELVDRLDTVAERLAAQGMTLGIHNTRTIFDRPLDAFRLQSLSGIGAIPSGVLVHLAGALSQATTGSADHRLSLSAYQHLVEATENTPIEFELDIKNVAAAGIDPEAIIDLLGDRLVAIHIADIDRTSRFPPRYASVDPGEGIVDIDRAIELGRRSPAEWLVFEHDRPNDPERALNQGRTVLAPVIADRRQPAAESVDGVELVTDG